LALDAPAAGESAALALDAVLAGAAAAGAGGVLDGAGAGEGITADGVVMAWA
jgi:hypothetical protein